MLRVMIVLAVLVWPAVAGAVSTLSADERAVLQQGLINTADAFILPAYETQADAADDLSVALAAYCAGTGPIAPVHAAFVETFLAWQRASIVGFGPIAEAEGPMRVQLWPDPKGFSARAVRSALRTEDPALLVDGGLAGRSIALTNLGALEHLLYGALAPNTYACDLARAIGAFQANLALDLVAGWTPGSDFRAAFETAAAGNATYPHVDAVARELLAGAVVSVDRLRKFKIVRGLGTEPGMARPERTEARLSDAGLLSIAASFRALADLYAVPLGLFDSAPDIGGSMDYFTLGDTAAAIADSLEAEGGSLAAIAAEDGARAAELRALSDRVLAHETFLKTGFFSAIGLTAGFTAADGD